MGPDDTARSVTRTTRRYRRVLAACLITLLTSVTLLGLIGLIRWRGRQALQSDTHTTVAQVAQQLVRTLQSRRGTLTFLRDTIDRQPDLNTPQLQAMGISGVEHTRHLLGVGLVREGTPPVWWVTPQTVARSELPLLNRAVVQRTQLRGIWRVPSTFVTAASAPRALLIMLEPLRSAPYRRSALIGLFDLKPLLEDFVAANVSSQHPVRIREGELLLYQSPGWRAATMDPRPIVVEQPIRIDATQWTLHMQPGSTHVARTLSWVNVLLIGLSGLAGLGVTAVVWLLAARTWILQRAVERRTAALRRTTRRLRQLAITDELTGLYNRRFFLERWERECERAKRYQRPLACLMIDINGFKQVNDQLGHHTGDLVLQQVSRELSTVLRHTDMLARFGGDEFVIALPETRLEQAELVAEKLRQLSIPLPDAAGHIGPVRLSVGIGRIEQAGESPQAVLQAADQSLYAFKRSIT